jgi:8-oxo-dGTP pyrophosphatase MutT (NUDIX family)
MYRKYRKGVFCVVYAGKRPMYLLLHRKLHWEGWELPKGGKKARERLKNTVKREVKEETGLNASNIQGYKFRGLFVYDKKTQAERKVRGFKYALLSCEVKKNRVRVAKEHDDFKWATYAKALKLLTWPDQKKCLRIVNNSLKKEKVE